MILAHHAGEQLVVAALATGGTTLLTGLAVFGRVKLAATVRWLRRR
ncbi:MAG TPA: hypothetical protein VHF23_10675 [Gaiellaceae bacterium]|nr:hypothetical protein [Gaiellaceae bacterium]